MNKPFNFKLRPVAAAVGALILCAGAPARAGAGFGDAVLQDGSAARIQTYFASSPSGLRQTVVPEGLLMTPQLGTTSGAALRKFVDPLPRLGAANAATMADGTTVRYLPVAVPEKWKNANGVLTGDDYYEIAVIEYRQKLHSDLRKATTMRGYVQLATPAWLAANPGKGVPLFYPDSTPALPHPILIRNTDANGFLAPGTKQAIAVDTPHFLGPVITATKGTPARVKFINLLPAGRAELAAPGVVAKRNGDVFLPVDKTLLGAGIGPDGLTEYTQNRANIHLHGGDTPWISDGTPHQWITPIGESDASNPKSLAGAFATDPNLDPTYLTQYLRGASAANVPDMPDPGPGAMTYYFPNQQSARLMWYHDHSVGQTRINVYAGMASAYALTDDVEKALMLGETPVVAPAGLSTKVLPGAADTIPLILQDRTFVPDDIALQDAKWNTTAWGQPGDSWFPHVYETVQDPAQIQNWNAVGRWHYGPWFWPVFPALYALPTGDYGDVSTTPEAWMDTPLVNGVAYPTTTVQPKPYRFKILNASNDRMMTFNLFVATDKGPDGITVSPGGLTEVPMVAAQPPAVVCPPGQARPTLATAAGVTTAVCTPDTWPTDARNGGVPDPAAVGPTIYQIGNEGGFLPQVARIEPTPINYLYDRGRATVLNVDTKALLLGPAERADVVIDFSQYAGKTLIVYSDSPAPVPAGDPRNDYFTGVGDQSSSGGAEDTRPGFGPNTRTMMQIKVAAGTGAALNEAALMAEIPKAYGLSQERPVAAQAVYNRAFGTTWADSFASIYTGSLKEPQFKFVPGSAGVYSVAVSNGGAGYVTAPTVALAGASAGAGAHATLKINSVQVTGAGSGYTTAPLVTITAAGGGGSGATAVATLAAVAVNVVSQGSGYSQATPPLVTFSAPPAAAAGQPANVRATGLSVVNALGRVTGVTITNPGTGYVSAPTVTIAAPTAGVRATATSVAGIGAVKLTSPDPLKPASAGGGGYTDMAQVLVTFTPPAAGGTLPTATVSGSVFDVTLVNPGTSTPTGVTFTGGGATTQASANVVVNQGSILVKSKAIQELFDPAFGRLNATLGVEVPFTSALTQTTIPLGYVDEPTENFSDGETQIWKITHNGVDTHPVHFHLLNVQLINRVGWDGFVTAPDPNEAGWKETVRMNPLEDVIVALRAKKPKLGGFGAPLSVRPMDPTQPLGSPFGFTQVDPNSGTPRVVTNQLTNYGWEYVWHCHILGHEENDFMRPVIFNANEAAPAAPSLLSGAATANLVTLNWSDNAVTEFQYTVERRIGAGAFGPAVPLLANANRYADPVPLAAGATATYRVTAVGANGSASATTTVVNVGAASPSAPTNLVSLGVTGLGGGSITRPQITLNWTDASTSETRFDVYRKVTGSAAAAVIVGSVTRSAAQGAATGGLVSFLDGTQSNLSGLRPAPGISYDYSVVAANAGGASVASGPLTVVLGSGAAPMGTYLPTVSSVNAVISGANNTVSATWAEEGSNSNAFYQARFRTCNTVNQIPCAANNWSGWTVSVPSYAANAVSASGVVFGRRGRQAQFQLQAGNVWGTGAWTASTTITLP